jgi:hypothetical protein
VKNNIPEKYLILLSASLFFFSNITIAQKKEFSIGVRIPVQIEFQKQNIAFPIVFVPKEQTATVFNYGIDVLAKKRFGKKESAYAGIGYFRDKFGFKKFYDHQLLNAGTDSLSIGTTTRNYIYNLIRFPLGFSYKVASNKNTEYKIGGEFILNYFFQKVYNGGRPFPSANNKVASFQYSGCSLNVFTGISIPIASYSLLELEPYVQVYHTYKQDKILYEDPNKTVKKVFDAIGLSFKYSLTFKNH